jgi:hypothetical protein
VPSRIDPLGMRGPTRGEAYGPKWRRTSHGFFVPASEDPGQVEQRIVEAAAVLPTYGGVTGWAALRWQGALWFGGTTGDGVTPIPVTLATMVCDIRPVRGIAVSEERLDPSELTELDGVRITTSMRSVTFGMRHAAGLRSAVLFADMAMYADLVSQAELAAWASSNRGWTGCPRLRDALPLTDENSWSPQETIALRLPWVLDAELPPPLTNRPVFDRNGRHLGTPDLLDEEAGVVGEYDGPVHLAGSRRGRDVRREAEFRRVGLETFVVTAADSRDPMGVVRRMQEARARARFDPPSRRAWTIDPPPGWVRTDTVARRRALDVVQRTRLLGYRIS